MFVSVTMCIEESIVDVCVYVLDWVLLCCRLDVTFVVYTVLSPSRTG